MKRFMMSVGTMLLALGAWVIYEINAIPDVLIMKEQPATRLTLHHVNIMAMAADEPQIQFDYSVEIEDGVISRIYPTPEATRIIAEDRNVIDGQGQFLMPGLIDAHIHLSDETELAGYLAYGVTGIRNMGGYPFHLRLQGRIETSQLLAPDFMTTGPILNSDGPNAAINQQIVNTAHEAQAAVRQHYEAGFSTLKLYSNLTEEAFDAIMTEAHQLKMPVTGHSPEGKREAGMPFDKPFSVAWNKTLRAGFQTLEHTETLVWHAFEDNLEEQRIAEIAMQLIDHEQALVPTLIAHRRLVDIALTQGAYLDEPEYQMISPLVELVDGGSISFWQDMDPSHYEVPHSEFFAKVTGELHRQGVTLLVGTDAGGFGVAPGASIHKELALLYQTGIPAYDVLKAATAVNAARLGFGNTGQIKAGYRANMLLLNNNPLHDLSELETPAAVVVRGQMLDSDKLHSLRQGAMDTSLTRAIIRAIELLWFIH